MEEQILVVDSEQAALHLPGEGFLTSEEGTLESLVWQARFCLRSEAEGNPLVRQLIPYVVVIRDGEAFAVTRSKGQSEARLHDKLSIGIGGHLNEPSVTSGALRELNEELLVDTEALSLEFLGFINDLSSAVSRDHLGCLLVCQVSGEVSVRETDKMWGQFRSLSYLRDHAARLEGWSQIAMDVLEQKGYLRT